MGNDYYITSDVIYNDTTTHPRAQWRDFFPLFICLVARIRLPSFFFHTHILPHLRTLVNTVSKKSF